jgi:hypothetical protein
MLYLISVCADVSLCALVMLTSKDGAAPKSGNVSRTKANTCATRSVLLKRRTEREPSTHVVRCL